MNGLGIRVACLWACASVFFFGLGPARLQAQPQTTTGTIRGTVDDPTGNAVLNAVVEARNESSGADTKSRTDDQGKFLIDNLAMGSYTVEVSAPGFALAIHSGVKIAAGQVQDLSFSLVIGDINQAVTVEATTTDSVAAQFAPMDGLLEARSARTEISPMYLREFTSPLTDYNETLDMAPGTYSYSQNGNGLGQSKLFFRGFPDGDYDINYDNVPFYDTNTPTHHSWSFFPGPTIGSVDFDRSPGDATSTGPTPFGGTINLLSPEMPNDPSVRLSVTGSSWNTILTDLAFDYGDFGPGKKSNLIADVNHLHSGGYENYNYQGRTAGMLKYQLKIAENNTLTMFSSVVVLDSDTSNFNGPTRAQVAQFGQRFYLTNVNTPDAPGATADFYPLNYNFYTYHVPTDTEYIDWKDELGHGWQIDIQPYTLSYYNHQFYNNPTYCSETLSPSSGCTSLAQAGLAFAFPTKPTSTTAGVGPSSAVDKLNSYRKYGENSTLSQSSKYGVFRVGVWYEWAKTDRFQIPSSPVTRVDALLPNFHEKFATFSTQPFAEYEWHPMRKLTITGGFKFADFSQNLKQYQDQKTILCPGGGTLTGSSNKITAFCMGGLSFETNTASYKAYLPSADINYRILPNWSVYAQYSRGTIVPPSAAFDTSKMVVDLPKPTGVWVSQGGSVLKLKRVTLNGDVYYIHYSNTYAAQTDPSSSSGIDWISSGDSVSKGIEGEANVYVGYGLSLYANATVGTAKYVSSGGNNAGASGFWVANAPSNTESIGVTYQQKNFDIGFFDKRIGPQWLDNNDAANFVNGTSTVIDHQVIPVSPFSLTDFYFNYTIRKGSHLDQTALRFSVNNLQDSHNIVGVTAFNPSNGRVWVSSLADQLTTLPGRSFAISLVFGYEPKGR
jgi:iron complex outermembrane recepter protein